MECFSRKSSQSSNINWILSKEPFSLFSSFFIFIFFSVFIYFVQTPNASEAQTGAFSLRILARFVFSTSLLSTGRQPSFPISLYRKYMETGRLFLSF